MKKIIFIILAISSFYTLSDDLKFLKTGPGVTCFASTQRIFCKESENLKNIEIENLDNITEIEVSHLDQASFCFIDNFKDLKCQSIDEKNLNLSESFDKTITSLQMGNSSACVIIDSKLKCFGRLSELIVEEDIKSYHLYNDKICAVLRDAESFKCYIATEYDGIKQEETAPVIGKLKDIYVGLNKSCMIDRRGLYCWGKNLPAFRPLITNLKNVVILSGYRNPAICVDNGNEIECSNKDLSLGYRQVFKSGDRDKIIGPLGANLICTFSNGSKVKCINRENKLTQGETSLFGSIINRKPDLGSKLKFIVKKYEVCFEKDQNVYDCFSKGDGRKVLENYSFLPKHIWHPNVEGVIYPADIFNDGFQTMNLGSFNQKLWFFEGSKFACTIDDTEQIECYRDISKDCCLPPPRFSNVRKLDNKSIPRRLRTNNSYLTSSDLDETICSVYKLLDNKAKAKVSCFKVGSSLKKKEFKIEAKAEISQFQNISMSKYCFLSNRRAFCETQGTGQPIRDEKLTNFLNNDHVDKLLFFKFLESKKPVSAMCGFKKGSKLKCMNVKTYKDISQSFSYLGNIDKVENIRTLKDYRVTKGFYIDVNDETFSYPLRLGFTKEKFNNKFKLSPWSENLTFNEL